MSTGMAMFVREWPMADPGCRGGLLNPTRPEPVTSSATGS